MPPRQAAGNCRTHRQTSTNLTHPTSWPGMSRPSVAPCRHDKRPGTAAHTDKRARTSPTPRPGRACPGHQKRHAATTGGREPPHTLTNEHEPRPPHVLTGHVPAIRSAMPPQQVAGNCRTRPDMTKMGWVRAPHPEPDKTGSKSLPQLDPGRTLCLATRSVAAACASPCRAHTRRQRAALSHHRSTGRRTAPTAAARCSTIPPSSPAPDAR